MKIDEMTLLYDYNYWANKRILDMAEQLTLEQLQQPQSFSWGSLSGTLVHTMDTEFGWRLLLQDQSEFDEILKPEDFPDVPAIRARWDEEEKAMRAYLASMNDENLYDIIRYQGDVPRERVLWHCLWHVVNHGMQHRSESAVMLTDFGKSPGEIDFTAFLNEQ